MCVLHFVPNQDLDAIYALLLVDVSLKFLITHRSLFPSSYVLLHFHSLAVYYLKKSDHFFPKELPVWILLTASL